MSDARTITPTHRPSNISTVTLPPSLEQCEAIDRAVAPLAKLARRSGWRFGPNGYFDHVFCDSGVSFAEIRQTTTAVEAVVRDLWPVVSRPATAADIAFYLGMLAVCFPDRRTEEERELFQHLLLIDVSNTAPSLHALQAACARLRRKFRFQQLQIADVIAALDQGKAKSKHTALLIESIPHMRERLDQEEQERREQERRRDPQREAAKAAEAAAYRAAEEARKRQKLRERIEDCWPPFHDHEYKWDDLHRLGLSGLCQGNILSVAGWEDLQKMTQAEVLARLDRLEAVEAETPKPPPMREPEPVKKPMARARARGTLAKGGRR